MALFLFKLFIIENKSIYINLQKLDYLQYKLGDLNMKDLFEEFIWCLRNGKKRFFIGGVSVIVGITILTILWLM